MIAHLRGRVLEKSPERIVLDVGGVGYEVSINPSTSTRLPEVGSGCELFISESTAMYGGSITLYGFYSAEEKQMFLVFKTMKATGAKKALEYLEKTTRSLPDFRRAIMDGDSKILKTLFGFTQKTAERLIAGLKDKLGRVSVSGSSKLVRAASDTPAESALAQAIDALSALGYSPAECRGAVENIRTAGEGMPADVAEIVRRALRTL